MKLALVHALALLSPAGEPDGIPLRLSETGLYADAASRTLAQGVLAYEPQYPLWTDGAVKRRWIRLPPGGVIDASDPDRFVFPVGTRFWKEFSFERRVETRMLWLDAEEGWRFATYVWSADGRDATLAPEQGVPGAHQIAPGVPFDVPARSDCCACHDAGPSPVLGFDALQLSPDRDQLAPHAVEPAADAVDLAGLVRRGLARGLPERFVETPPRIAAASPRERAALGYLDANCGMCHSSASAIPGLDLDLSYALGRSGPPPARATAVDRPSAFRWPGDADPRRISRSAPERSVLTRRMASRQPLSQMPPLGTHLRDSEALELVSAWIREDLAPRPVATQDPTTVLQPKNPEPKNP